MYNLTSVSYTYEPAVQELVVPVEAEEQQCGGLVLKTSKEIALDDKEGRLAQRAAIEAFQKAMNEHTGDFRGDADKINEEGLIEHRIGDVYIRELFIPADTAIVSKLWNRDRLWIIAKGEVTMTTETGDQKVVGPYVTEPPFGSKVAFYTHTDTLWFAIAGNVTSNNPEEEVTVDGYDDLTYPWDLIEHKGDK